MIHAQESIRADGHLLVLEGEAGIGKTRLAEAFVQHARDGGSTTLAARCYEGESGLAYGPFVQCLRTAAGRPGRGHWTSRVEPQWLSEAARLAPEIQRDRPGLPPTPPLDSPGAQARFYEGLGHVLQAACGPRGVFFVDDVHWTDEASMELLSYLAHRLSGRPICILLTWRSEEVPAGHRLRTLLAEGERTGSATGLALSRLELSALAELVQAMRSGGADLPSGLESWLHQETEGLPFFVVEYLEAMLKRAGTDSGEDPLAVPPSVQDLLDSRVAATSETGAQLLATASVVGRSFSFDTLREASGRSEQEGVTALEELMGLALVREVKGGDGPIEPTYDFTHERLRAHVYEGTSLARRRLLHGRVADALAARVRSPAPGSHAGQIAHHYQSAGRELAAAEYHKMAAEHARSLYANAEALAHLRSALALGHPDTAWLHEGIGDLQTLAAEYAAALHSYETAAALSTPDALAGLEHRLGSVHHRRGAWDLAVSHFESALGALGEDGHSGTRARVYADWSLTAHHAGQTSQASRYADLALELADSAGDTGALAQTHNILGILAKSRGDLDEAIGHLEQSLTLAEALKDPEGARIAALNNLALACSAQGETERAIDLLETALALCSSLGDRHREAALSNNLADVLHAAARPAEAMAHLKRAVTVFTDIGEEDAMEPEIWKLVEW